MTSQTHKKYSITFALLEVIVLYRLGLTEINYYLSLVIALAIAKSGALFPDVDHAWCNVKEKTVVNKVVNTLIHITGGRHRSWQTHSIDICGYFTVAAIYVPQLLQVYGKIDEVNKEVLTLVWLSFAVGWISHMFSDMLTSEGVRIFCFSKTKIALVPKKIGKLKFKTGEAWEEFNYKVMSFINVILGVIALAYPILPIIEDMYMSKF